MNWETTLKRLHKLVGKKLKSVSGKADISVVAVDDDGITVGAKTIDGRGKQVHRSIAELRGIVSQMKLNVPVHVDAAVKGSGSSRSHPETILANMPDVEWTKIEGRKHIMWVGAKTHPLGSLRKRD